MTEAPWAVSIVIPARSEATSIGPCVRSVVAAASSAGHPFDVTVVADRCDDETAALALRALDGCGRVLEIEAGSVGAARRMGAARSLRSLAARGHAPHRSWLLATDADSTVPTEWVAAHLRHADLGAQGVAGIVVVDSFEEHHPSVERSFHQRYEIGLSGEHPHVHGTNLGVRADAYQRAGGWRPGSTGEDHDLWNRLKQIGVPLVSTADAPVRTSGRTDGRAPDGFAALLRSLATEEATDDLAR